MCRAPNLRAPASTMRSTSASSATSPCTASAVPPARATASTVWWAAASSMSATTTRAPSPANRRAAARPMPIPAPVMTATLSARRSAISDALGVPHQLPVRDGAIEGLLLEAGGVQVMLHDRVTERGGRHRRAFELGDGFAQRLRHLGERGVLVGIALVETRRLELGCDPVETRGHGGREGEIGIGVGAGNPILHAKAVPV